jgi:CRP/FNR family transcriptional regulator
MEVTSVRTLAGEAWSRLLPGQLPHRVPAGTRLYHEGDRPDDAHFVHAGLIKLTKHARTGPEVLIELRGPGDLVGGHSAIDGLPRFASARTLTESAVTTVRRDQFVTLVRQDADVAVAMLSDFSQDLRITVRRLVERSASDAVALVATRLLEFVRHPMFEPFRVATGSTTIIDMPISQRELASWAGVSPRSMAIALHDLRDGGIISTSRLHVEVHDAPALADRCNGGSHRLGTTGT